MSDRPDTPASTSPVLPAESVAGTWQRVTQYVVGAVPEDLCEDAYHWQLTVEWRGPDQWAVMHHGFCLTSKGEWDYEVRPSERTEQWKTNRRFPLEDALRLAHEHAPRIEINGITAADLLAKYARIDGEDCAGPLATASGPDPDA